MTTKKSKQAIDACKQHEDVSTDFEIRQRNVEHWYCSSVKAVVEVETYAHEKHPLSCTSYGTVFHSHYIKGIKPNRA